jgi:hypothetical protein
MSDTSGQLWRPSSQHTGCAHSSIPDRGGYPASISSSVDSSGSALMPAIANESTGVISYDGNHEQTRMSTADAEGTDEHASFATPFTSSSKRMRSSLTDRITHDGRDQKSPRIGKFNLWMANIDLSN